MKHFVTVLQRKWFYWVDLTLVSHDMSCKYTLDYQPRKNLATPNGIFVNFIAAPGTCSGSFPNSVTNYGYFMLIILLDKCTNIWEVIFQKESLIMVITCLWARNIKISRIVAVSLTYFPKSDIFNYFDIRNT